MNSHAKRSAFSAALSLFAAGMIFFCQQAAAAKDISALSPDGKLKMEISAGEDLSLTLKMDGKTLLKDAKIGLDTSLGKIGKSAKPLSVKNLSADETIETVWWTKAKISNRYNETVVEFDNFSLILRLYDDAAAYRFQLKGKGDAIVKGETLTLPFPDDTKVSAHPYDPACESNYKDTTVGGLKKLKNGLNTSLLIHTGDAKILFTESDMISYPAMRLRYPDTDGAVLSANFAPYPKTLKKHRNIFLFPDKTEDYIAKRPAEEPMPWRVFIIARKDIDLLGNDAVYKLARPSKLADTSWIRTGTCSWEWWNDANLEGVDFKTGMNTPTYDYFADFSVKNKLPFMLIDAGWVEDYDTCADAEPEFDMPEVIKRANAGAVGVFAWLTMRSVSDEASARKTLERLKKWGAAGVKVDFTNRDDQLAMEFFENFARIASEYKMLVDYHGCPKPAGLSRTYPNVVNFEAVRGGEMNKFGDSITPRHNIDIAYTRMAVGPMDYTPGATRNVGVAGKGNTFPVSYSNPAAQGTRANAAAMYIVYFEPLKMLSDSPTQYEKNLEFFNFIKGIPTVWDETKPLQGEYGKYLAIARRKGKDWYVGAMTDSSSRKMEIKLDFLDDGAVYEAEIFSDGANADKAPTDAKISKLKVSKSDVLKVSMAPAGGFSAKIRRID